MRGNKGSKGKILRGARTRIALDGEHARGGIALAQGWFCVRVVDDPTGRSTNGAQRAVPHFVRCAFHSSGLGLG
eukprot:200765-Prymnesium_polylepis.2